MFLPAFAATVILLQGRALPAKMTARAPSTFGPLRTQAHPETQGIDHAFR
jgi:hypothetical protein